ncbi:MAG: hypothetical protein GKC10_03740 [Methanosarcinales archaeon]|nr:hypothetical protein [Methanosarcinales archaeon]
MKRLISILAASAIICLLAGPALSASSGEGQNNLSKAGNSYGNCYQAGACDQTGGGGNCQNEDNCGNGDGTCAGRGEDCANRLQGCDGCGGNGDGNGCGDENGCANGICDGSGPRGNAGRGNCRR